MDVRIADLLDQVAKNENILQYTISNVEFNEKGEGFSGEICQVTVSDKTSDRKLQLIIKQSFNNEKVRNTIPILESFENEINFYQVIYPGLQRFSEIAIDFIPKCFLCSTEDKFEVLILDNLKHRDFQIFDKKSLFDDDHVALIFKKYGEFHAWSFALRHQDPEEFAKLTAVYQPAFLKLIQWPRIKQATIESCQLAGTFLDQKHIAEQYKKYTQGDVAIDLFMQCWKRKSKWCTIIHGDCWSNNMLFKYEGNGDERKPTDLRLIDWQLSMVGSPVCDLSYCLYSGASKRQFDQLETFLQIYSKSFSAILEKFHITDVEFSLDQLKEEWRQYAKFGMMMSFLLLRIKLGKKEDVAKINDSIVNGVPNNRPPLTDRVNRESFQQRMRDILVHMYETGSL